MTPRSSTRAPATPSPTARRAADATPTCGCARTGAGLPSRHTSRGYRGAPPADRMLRLLAITAMGAGETGEGAGTEGGRGCIFRPPGSTPCRLALLFLPVAAAPALAQQKSDPPP